MSSEVSALIGQLKPSRDSFDTFVFSGVKRFDVFVLCEGKTDAEVIKEIVRKLGVRVGKAMAITDCEGIDRLYGFAAVVALLVRLFRKVKVLGVVVDADRLGVDGRLGSLVDSLSSKGLEVAYGGQVSGQTFELFLEEVGIPVYVAINAVEEYRYLKHELEDHIVKLLELEGKIDRDDVAKASTAEEYLFSRGYEVLEVVKSAAKQNVEKALNHLVTLLNCILTDPL